MLLECIQAPAGMIRWRKKPWVNMVKTTRLAEFTIEANNSTLSSINHQVATPPHVLLHSPWKRLRDNLGFKRSGKTFEVISIECVTHNWASMWVYHTIHTSLLNHTRENLIFPCPLTCTAQFESGKRAGRNISSLSLFPVY